MTDKELYGLCKCYGIESLQAKRRFLLLLPEVARRGLYKKRGFSSLNEFAARLCGVRREQVGEVLRLEEKFWEFPVLYKALHEGEIALSKFTRVASVVNLQNQDLILHQIKTLSKGALEVWVRELKIANGLVVSKDVLPGKESALQMFGEGSQFVGFSEGGGVNDCEGGVLRMGGAEKGLLVNDCANKSMREEVGVGALMKVGTDVGVGSLMAARANLESVKSSQQNDLNVDFEVIGSFSQTLKNELKLLIDKGINVDELLRQLLQQYQEKLQKENEEIALENEQMERYKKLNLKLVKVPKVGLYDERYEEIRRNLSESLGDIQVNFYCLKINEKRGTSVKNLINRHIPEKIKRQLKAQYGTKCSEVNCRRRAKNVHHEKPFARYHTHDPRFLKPLCREHHELMHC